MKMSFSDKLTELRKRAGLTQPAVAEYLSQAGFPITNKAVSKWENGVSSPDARQFITLCRLYEVRDVLAEFANDAPADGLAALNPEGRRRACEYIKFLAATDEFSKKPPKRDFRETRTLPLYDLPVSAGTGLFLDSDHYELIDVDDAVPLAATFAVRISGDSMTPRFVDHQVVYVKQQQSLESGEIGIFLLNGDAYCKKLVHGYPTQLVSLNSTYKPIPIRDTDEFRIIGRVIG